MKVLFLCGVFASENEKEVIARAKRPVEYSANIFQEKMIKGFDAAAVDFRIVSAPFIGSFPNASSIVNFKGFEQSNAKYEYVSFCNIWGIRNFSRAKSLKKKIKEFAHEKDSEKLIVIYSPHTPFLEAAVYAKRIDPNIKICLVVPDLPQFMNLNAKISLAYKIGKKYDIAKFNRLNKKVDSYMLLTEEMKNMLHVGKKPYIVFEGIITDRLRLEKLKTSLDPDQTEKIIVYTGKTNEKFGVKNLVDAFGLIDSPEYRLIICGCGDSDAYILEKAKEDCRIEVKGQVTPEVALGYVSKAAVLVNPRMNDEEYTKYSFPSKNIEYLMSGNSTVAYLLDGIPPIYRDFMYVPTDNSVHELKNAIITASNASTEERMNRRNAIAAYFEKLTASNIIQELIHLNFECK